MVASARTCLALARWVGGAAHFSSVAIGLPSALTNPLSRKPPSLPEDLRSWNSGAVCTAVAAVEVAAAPAPADGGAASDAVVYTVGAQGSSTMQWTREGAHTSNSIRGLPHLPLPQRNVQRPEFLKDPGLNPAKVQAVCRSSHERSWERTTAPLTSAMCGVLCFPFSAGRSRIKLANALESLREGSLILQGNEEGRMGVVFGGLKTLSSSSSSAALFSTLPTRRAEGVAGEGSATFREGEAGAEEYRQEVSMQRLKGPNRGIALLLLNRPQARNAIGVQFLSELRQSLHEIAPSEMPAQVSTAAADAENIPREETELEGVDGGHEGKEEDRSRIRAVVVASAAKGVFCAGADLKERRRMTASEARDFVDRLRDTFTWLERLPVPTIAAIEGTALGGGLEMALACDMRVCGADAQMGLPETSLAIIPGAGGTQRLPRLVGRAKAKELIFTARRVGAGEAVEIGLANYAVAEGQAVTKALEVARRILHTGPVAIRLAKRAIDRGSHLDIDAGLAVERGAYGEVLRTEDRLEGLAAFAEKREPNYKGR